MDFKQFLRVLFKRLWIIALVSIIATGATYYLLKSAKPKYQSSTQIATGFTDIHENRSENTTNAINNKFNNLEEFLTSPNVFYLISYRLFIHDAEQKPFRSKEALKAHGVTNEELNNALKVFKEKLKKGESMDISDEDEKRLVKILEWLGYSGNPLYSSVSVKRVSNTDFIEISSTTDHKYLSAFIVNVMAEEGIEAYNNSLRRKLENTISFYDQLVNKKKNELNKYLDSLKKYKTETQVVDYNTESQNKLERLASLEMAKEQQKQKITSLTQSLSSINTSLHGSNGLDKNQINKNIAVLKQKIQTLNKRIVNGSGNSKVLSDSISLLRNELNTQTQLYNSLSGSESNFQDELKARKINTKIELDVAKSELYAIQRGIDTLQKEVGSFASNETSLSALESTIDVLKTEYLDLLNRYNQSKNATMDISRLHTVQKGQPAINAQPNKASILGIIAGIVSGAFGIVLLFLVEYFDNSIRNGVRLQSQTDIPLIGELNSIKGKSINIDEVFSGTTELEKTQSMFLSQVRKARYHLEKSHDQIFLITSFRQGEGKTTTLISLAYSIALLNKKVLIIDTNFKNNTLTTIFSAKAGLKSYIHAQKPMETMEAEYADTYQNISEVPEEPYEDDIDEEVNSKEMEISRNWLQYITPSGLAGVDVIGCEKTTLSPSEIFAGKPFDVFLTEMRKYYDYILLEGACLNRYSDSKEIAIYCDKIVTVISADRSFNNNDQGSFEFISEIDDQYLGAILNKIKPEEI